MAKPVSNQLKTSGTYANKPLDERVEVNRYYASDDDAQNSIRSIESMSGAYVGLHVYVTDLEKNGTDKRGEYVITKLTSPGNDVDMSGVKSVLEFIGAASQTSVTALTEKIDKLPTGYYYGQFADVASLPDTTQISTKGYAYVASSDPAVYYIYLYDGEGDSWQDSGNKFVTTSLETNLSTKSQIKAPTTKAVKEGIEAVDVTTEQEFTSTQKETARENLEAQKDIVSMANKLPVIEALNNRAAVVNQQTSEVQTLGYKVLNPSASFASQVEGVGNANTIFEIRDEFNLNNANVTIPANCTLKFNGGKIKNGTIVGNGTVIDASRTTIFDSDVIFSGTFVGEAYPEWVGDNINKCVRAFRSVRLAPNKTYDVTETIVMPWNGSIVGDSTSVLQSSVSPVIDCGYQTLLDGFAIRVSHVKNVINFQTENISNTYAERDYYTGKTMNVNNILITSPVTYTDVDTIPTQGLTDGMIVRLREEETGYTKDNFYKYNSNQWVDVTADMDCACVQILSDGYCSNPNVTTQSGVNDINLIKLQIVGRWGSAIKLDVGTNVHNTGDSAIKPWITDVRIDYLSVYFARTSVYLGRNNKGKVFTDSELDHIYLLNSYVEAGNQTESFVHIDAGELFCQNSTAWDFPSGKYPYVINQDYGNLILSSSKLSDGFYARISRIGTSKQPGFRSLSTNLGGTFDNAVYGSINSYFFDGLGEQDGDARCTIGHFNRLPYGFSKIMVSTNIRAKQLKIYTKVDVGTGAYVYLLKLRLYGQIGILCISHGAKYSNVLYTIYSSTENESSEIPDWRFISPMVNISDTNDFTRAEKITYLFKNKLVTYDTGSTKRDALGHYFTANQFVSDVSEFSNLPASSDNMNGGKILLDKSTNKLYSYNNTTQNWYDAAGVEVAGMTDWYGTATNLPTPTLNKGIGSRFLITDLHRWVTWFGSAWYYDDGTLPSEFIQVDQKVVNFDSAAADSVGKIVTAYIADGVIGSVVYEYSSIPAVKVDDTHIKITTTNNSLGITQGNEIYIIKDIVVTRLSTFPQNPTDGQIVYTTSDQTIDGTSYPAFNFYQYSEDSSSWSDITTTFTSDASKFKKILAYQPGSVMTISPSSYEFPAEGGSQEFTATTYSTSLSEVTIVPVDADWITKGTIANKKITLTAAENTGAARQVSVTFKDSNNKTATVVIAQEAGGANVEE